MASATVTAQLLCGRRSKGGPGRVGKGGEEGKVAEVLFLFQKVGKALKAKEKSPG